MTVIRGGFHRPCKHRKAALLTLAISVLAMAFPARALGAQTSAAQPKPTSNGVAGGPSGTAGPGLGKTLLVLGSGYGSPDGSPVVRVAQRRLALAGYPTAVIDGLYGPRTRQAVVAFQAAHGLQVDGVVGPRTWAALRRPVIFLGSGAGDLPGGTDAVRSLQRRLASAGDSPGPIDGRYGALTEGAVRQFQREHGLPVNGTAGPRTRALLSTPALSVRRSLRRSNPLPQGFEPTGTAPRPATRSNPSSQPAGATAASGTRQGPGSAARAVPQAGHGPGPGAVPWIVILGGLALSLALALAARWLLGGLRPAPSGSEGRPRANGAQVHTNGHHAEANAAGIGEGVDSRLSRGQADDCPKPAETACAFNLGLLLEGQGGMVEAQAACGRADERGHGTAASNLGRLLEEQGALAEAEAAYRRADACGDSAGAFYLGLLLEGQGGVAEAQEAYGRADERGHGTAASNLGRLLVEQGALAEAEAAYRRADGRGDADGAFNLGVLLAERGAWAQAEAAFKRAAERGDAVAASNLGVLLEDRGALAEAEEAYRRADERGSAEGAFNLGVRLVERGALTDAEAAFRRAEQRDDPNVASMARGALLDLRREEHEPSAGRVAESQHA